MSYQPPPGPPPGRQPQGQHTYEPPPGPPPSHRQNVNELASDLPSDLGMLTAQQERLDYYQYGGGGDEKLPAGPPPSYYEALGGSSAPPLLRDAKAQAAASDSKNFDSLSRNMASTHLSHGSSVHASTSSSSSSDSDSDEDELTPGEREEEARDDDEIMRTALEFTHHRPPPSYSIPELAKPVAIPQLTHGIGNPYARAYAPALQVHGISMEELMAFIDHLNIITTGSPPLQVLSLVGNVVSQVPNEWAQIAGTITNIGAGISSRVLSYTRGDRYIKTANNDFFHPRKLHVTPCDIDALRSIARIPPQAPLAAPLSADNITASIVERRMAALEQWLSPLTMAVPPPDKPTSTLQKLCAHQVQRNSNKQERKAMRRRAKALRKNRNLSPQDAARITAELRAHGDRRLNKRADKLERKMDKRARKDAKRGHNHSEAEFRAHGRDEREKGKIWERASHDAEKAIRKGDYQRVQQIERRRDQEIARVDRDFQQGFQIGPSRDAQRQELRGQGYLRNDRELKTARKGKWLVITAWDGKEPQSKKWFGLGGSGANN